jgi:hypothetical protein
MVIVIKQGDLAVKYRANKNIFGSKKSRTTLAK